MLLEDERKIPVKGGAFRLDLPARGVAVLSPQPFAPREKIYREEGMRPYNAPAEEDAESALLKHGSWIWRKCETPAGSRSFFRRSFDGEKVRKAELYVTADDFYRFRLNGRPGRQRRTRPIPARRLELNRALRSDSADACRKKSAGV